MEPNSNKFFIILSVCTTYMIKSKKTKIVFILMTAVAVSSTIGFSNTIFAEKPNYYTVEEIAKAFHTAQKYAHFGDMNKIIISSDVADVYGIVEKDMKIMTEWAELHNNLMDALLQKDERKIDVTMSEIKNGKFAPLTSAITMPISITPTTIKQVSWSYFSLTACGITYGSTSHAEPTVVVGIHGYDDKDTAAKALEGLGFHEISYPYTDWDLRGYDFGKKNYAGYAECDNGEFRDQHVIYDESTHWMGSVAYGPTHTLAQHNEPNPEVFSYDNPTFWWAVYTADWHYSN